MKILLKNSKRENNLAYAVKKWIRCGKDKKQFYEWMKKQGYVAKNIKGYWKLSNTLNNDDYETSRTDDNYTEIWSGGNGSYTYKCIFTGHHWYTASTHDDCHGEYVESTGTISQPKEKYFGGDKVYIIVIFGGGNNTIDTAYEYTWHTK